MRTLKDLLPQKKNTIFPGDLDEQTVFYIWKKVVMEEYGIRGSENIIPQNYKNKKLFLASQSSLWGNEIWLQRDFLRKRMNEIMGNEVVVEIKVFGR